MKPGMGDISGIMFVNHYLGSWPSEGLLARYSWSLAMRLMIKVGPHLGKVNNLRNH